MAKEIPKNITREMLLEEANKAKSEISDALSRAYAQRDFLSFGQKKVTPEMKEVDKRIKLLLEQDKIVDKIIKDNTAKMRHGGTTGNKNWFQKAIAQTGTLNLGGWKKTQPRAERRLRAYSSHKDASNTVHDASLSTARALQALANVTQDADTKKKAKSDADYFFKQAKESKKKKVGMKSRGGMYESGGEIHSRAQEIEREWAGMDIKVTTRDDEGYATNITYKGYPVEEYNYIVDEETAHRLPGNIPALIDEYLTISAGNYSYGGTTSSAWTKFKKWLGEEI